MSENKTFIKRVTQEWEDFWSAKFIIKLIVILLIAGFVWISYSELFRIPSIKEEVANLRDENNKKAAEIQRIETLLIPFKTIALEKYTGSEQAALRKLAKELQELKNYVNPLKKPIASATASVEVTIKSEEQVSTRYMNEGGYLAFVKSNQSLLLTSDTKSSARQTGNGEVIYKGTFQMRPDRSAIGKPVELLGASDLIQIKFSRIPNSSEVIKGKAAIVINGNLRFEFEIPPQIMIGDKILIRDIRRKFLTTGSRGRNK